MLSEASLPVPGSLHTGLHVRCETLIGMVPKQVARAANRQLLEQPGTWQSHDTEATLAIVSSELGSEQEQTRLEALHWVNVLLGRDRTVVWPHLSAGLNALLCKKGCVGGVMSQ